MCSNTLCKLYIVLLSIKYKFIISYYRNMIVLENRMQCFTGIWGGVNIDYVVWLKYGMILIR